MPRRYGPLRVVRWPRGMGGDQNDGVKAYFQRLALMAPAEVTGFYLTFRVVAVGNLDRAQQANDPIAPWWPWACFGLAIVYRSWATHGADSLWRGQVVPVAVAAVAFLLWVLSMGHVVGGLSDLPLFQDPRAAPLLAALFTFVVPMLYTGDPPDRPAPRPSPG